MNKTTPHGLPGCIRILVIEQIREPIGVFWSFAAPIAYMFLTLPIEESAQSSTQAYMQKAAFCLAYMAFVSAGTGFGLYLVGRRESGFIRSFLINPKTRRRFLTAQYLASFSVATAYGAAFVLSTAWAFSDIGMTTVISLVLRYMLTTACLMFGALVLVSLPMTFQSSSSAITVFTTIAIVMGLSMPTLGLEKTTWLLYLNPFGVAMAVLFEGHLEPLKFGALAVQALVLGLLGIYGIKHLRLNPEWSNR